MISSHNLQAKTPSNGFSMSLRHFNFLPPEVVLDSVFSLIHPIELWQCRRVCKRWCSWINAYFRALKSLSFNDAISEYYLTAVGLELVTQSLQLLRELRLDQCYRCVTERSLVILASRCHQLEILSVPQCREVTDNALRSLAEHCPSLRELNLNCCFQVSDQGLEFLAGNCKNLRQLCVSRCFGVTDRGITAIVQGCPYLHDLDIGWCYKVSDQKLRMLILERVPLSGLVPRPPRRSGNEPSMPVPKRLPPLPTIADIIRLYGLSAKSQLSQNFLLDMNVTDRLVRLAGDITDCCVCEVGPGPGSLTRSILNAGPAKLLAVEKDRRFLPSLELLRDASGERLEIYHGDALKFDMEKECGPYVERKDWSNDPPTFHVMGNLPFNVSIPLLLQWLSMIPRREGPFVFGRSQLTLTFQKEVAERIIAPPSHTQRSRLSIMVQHLCHVQWGFKIRGVTFVPPPKVDAVVLKLIPLIKPAIDVDYYTLEKVVKALFQYRRKYIRKGATLLFPDHPELAPELFKRSGVEDTLRAQQLSLTEFERLCNAYTTLIRNYYNMENRHGTLEHESTSDFDR